MRVRATAGMGRRVLIALLLMTGWLAAAPTAQAMDPRQPFHSYVLDHWGVEQGLPQITVLDMAEDSAGFLWLNTQSVVARFDGTRFVRYDRATTGVDTSMLGTVWADPRGGVWFGGTRGLLRQRDGHFTALGGAAVNAIIDAGDGTPLLATADGVHYSVRDNGLGIKPEHQQKVFRVFQRVHPGVGTGEGMGLAIVARVIERHRGEVWVESVEGAGSTFHVVLPGGP